MAKRIVVQTNDARKKNLTLVVKGFVKKFATIRPKRVQLNGTVGEEISQTVAIVPEKEYPFTITSTTAKQGNDIKFVLTEKEGNTGTEYELVIKNKRQTAGRYHDIVVLKTDSPLKPELQVRVAGNITMPKSEDSPEAEPAVKKSDSDQNPDKKDTPSKKEASGGMKSKDSTGSGAN